MRRVILKNYSKYFGKELTENSHYMVKSEFNDVDDSRV